MRVYVINKHGRPLMPCTPRTARLLLRDKCAKVIRRDPFTIKLLIGVSGYTQDLVLGIDPGSKYIGSAVRDKNNRVMYLSEIHQRTDIKKKMDDRRMYRRTRRNRKTRYRKPRFLNRKNSIKEDRYPPTLESKYNTITREINFVCQMMPITKIYIEMAKFDIHALTNPAVLNRPWMYQKGPQFGFYNVKAYVLSRDNYTCCHCKNKKKDPHLQVHHIIPRSKGGSDVPKNLLTLCSTCHKDVHSGSIVLSTKAIKSVLSHATQMNVLRSMIKKRFEPGYYLETLGAIAKGLREYFGYPKEHYWDAFFGSLECGKEPQIITNSVLVKRCVGKGTYAQTSGRRSEKKMPTGKICGFRRWDKVEYKDTVCFIKGRMSSGYFILSDIFGEKIDFKPIPKSTTIKRLSARKSWIMST